MGRREDPRLLRARARFADDIHLDRMVHGVFLRSPMAHAKVVSIDASRALSAGARAVLAARDLPFIERRLAARYWNPNIRGGKPPLLAVDRVRYVGEPVALLVADDRYRAEDLALLVEVDYRPLPVLATAEAAMEPEALRIHDEWTDNVAAELVNQAGDAAAVMDSCPRRLSRRFRFGRQSGLPLEPRGCVAEFDAGRGRLTAWVSTQTHYSVRANLAELLDLPEQAVRVVAEDVGGGFGAKSRPYPEEIVVSYASRLLGRPVKWIEDRAESLRATTHSRATDTRIEVGYDDDGRIHALRARLIVDIGAYVAASGVLAAEVAAGQCAGPYGIPNVEVNALCVGTNKTPAATYRGAGQPEATFPLECMLDLVAADLGISASEVRLRNIVAPRDMPYAPSIPYAGPGARFESGDFPAMVRRAADRSEYHESVETLPSGERAAWGLACGIEATGFVGLEAARIRVDGTGNVALWSGLTTQGQGQATACASVVAEILGIAPEQVWLGDTDALAFGHGTFASRGAVVGANAVAGAARRLRAKILECAGALLQRRPEELEMRRGAIACRGGETTGLSLAEIARAVSPGGQLHAGAAALEAEFVHDSRGTLTFALSVHAAKIAVDRQSGRVRIVDYYVLHDAGRMLNEMIVEGQIVGGAVEGMGCAALSEILYDENGQLLTGTLADYLVMTAAEAPRVRLDHVRSAPTTNPLGVRGVGEGGVMPAPPAVVNAVSRIAGPRADLEPLYSLPLRPEAVLAATNPRPGASAGSLETGG